MAEGTMRITEFCGIDHSVDAASIDPRFAADAQNVVCEGGRLASAKGCIKLSAEGAPEALHSLAAFHSRKRPYLLGIGEGGVYALLDDGCWETLYEGEHLGRAAYLNYAKDGRDILVLACGTKTLWWDGEGPMEALPGAPSGLSHLALHYERVWAAGSLEEPDTVHWSRPYAADNWQPHPEMPEAGGGFVLVPTWNGGRVRGLKNFFGDVVVFKDEDIFRIYGTYPGNYEVVRVHGIVGPLAERTIVAWNDRVYFFSREGLCAYDGVSAKPIGAGRVRRFFEGVDYALAARTACAAVCGDVLTIALPEIGQTHNNAMLEVDLRRDVWMIRRGMQCDDLLVMDGKLIACSADGHVYAMNEGESYDGAPINTRWVSKEMDFGQTGARKWGGKLHLTGTGGLQTTQRTDRTSRTSTVHFGDALRYRATRLRGTGRRMQLTLSSLDGQPFALQGGLSWDIETGDD